MMSADETVNENDEQRRPLGLNLLCALYLFFFLVSFSTVGNPFPFLGTIYQGSAAKMLVFADSIISLYLFLGLMKRQRLTWYLLLGYNLFEIANIVVNLSFIRIEELEKVTGGAISRESLFTNNIACALAILLLTQFIYRHRSYFTNRRLYLF